MLKGPAKLPSTNPQSCGDPNRHCTCYIKNTHTILNFIRPIQIRCITLPSFHINVYHHPSSIPQASSMAHSSAPSHRKVQSSCLHQAYSQFFWSCLIMLPYDQAVPVLGTAAAVSPSSHFHPFLQAPGPSTALPIHQLKGTTAQSLSWSHSSMLLPGWTSLWWPCLLDPVAMFVPDAYCWMVVENVRLTTVLCKWFMWLIYCVIDYCNSAWIPV